VFKPALGPTSPKYTGHYFRMSRAHNVHVSLYVDLHTDIYRYIITVAFSLNGAQNTDTQSSGVFPLFIMNAVSMWCRFFFYLVGWDLTPIRSLCRSPRFVSQYCGHILAYCTFTPDDT
jgi:hypothetical protein